MFNVLGPFGIALKTLDSTHYHDLNSKLEPSMDVITGAGLVASIIQIIDATTKAIKYLNDVKDAPKDRVQLAHEATSILVLLTQLRYRLEGEDAKASWYAGIRGLGSVNGPLMQLHGAMLSLAKRLEPSFGMKRAAKALVWTIEKKECTEILGKIQRLNLLVSLALQGDRL